MRKTKEELDADYEELKKLVEESRKKEYFSSNRSPSNREIDEILNKKR